MSVDRDMPPVEFWETLADLLRDVSRAMGASGAVDQNLSAMMARVETALRASTPLLRELADHRTATHRAAVDAAYARGRAEGHVEGLATGRREGEEAGKAAAIAERQGVVEILTRPIVTFARAPGGQAVLATVALPLAILLLRACVLGEPVQAVPGAVPGLPAPTTREAPDGP